MSSSGGVLHTKPRTRPGKVVAGAMLMKERKMDEGRRAKGLYSGKQAKTGVMPQAGLRRTHEGDIDEAEAEVSLESQDGMEELLLQVTARRQRA